jgi:NAD(P)-dependent dehydrogenase (short-subunit alcohol dehydrogenase family)
VEYHVEPERNEQVVLITGCSSGFGELIARTLARAGHNVFATMRGVADRNAEAASALTAWARRDDLRLQVVEMDVAGTASVAAGVAKVFDSAGRIDVVVNNAGIAAGGPLEAFDIEQMQELYNINVFGPLRVDKAVLPHMRERRSGLLIHVSSTLGRVLPGTGGLYPASNWAREGLAETLHYQLRPFEIDVVILEPGSFPTPATSKGLRPNNTEVAAAYDGVASMARRAREASPDYTPPDPQEVADAVLRIIETPAGQRPLRQVVGPIFTKGVAEYNQIYERVRDALAESLRRPEQATPWARGR